MDGVTGTIQEKMKAGYKVEKWSMMFYMNLFSAIILTGSIFAFHDLFNFLGFVQKYPYVIQRIGLLSIAGAFGQIFIFKTVSDLGPLNLSIITTSRKLISVVISVILFSNPFTKNQAIGTIVVFSALFADVWESSRRKLQSQVPEKVKNFNETKKIKQQEEEGENVNESDYDNVPDAVPLIKKRKPRRD